MAKKTIDVPLKIHGEALTLPCRWIDGQVQKYDEQYT